VGVYDSGVGGLSVLRALRAVLPKESFIYVADSHHAPYGDRTPQFVQQRAEHVARFLFAQGAKALVIACNTASVVAARHLRAIHSAPIVAMEPAIKPGAQMSRSRVVVVMATVNTIRSESVAQLCRLHGADARLILLPCPGLADLVEQGQLHGDVTRGVLEQLLRPGLTAGADTIVLGCTHYAFLTEEIARVAGPAVNIVEPSQAVARQLARVLQASAPVLNAGPPATVFYTSGVPDKLENFLSLIGEPPSEVRVLPERDE
jgi:glutamate racemase